MHPIFAILILVTSLGPACSVYHNDFRSEHVVDVERLEPGAIPETGRAANDGLTVVKKDGSELSWAHDTIVHRRGDTVVIGPVGGRALAELPRDEVAEVDLRNGIDREVRHRKRDAAGSAIVTTLAVAGVTTAALLVTLVTLGMSGGFGFSSTGFNAPVRFGP